ncbi:sigma-54-dependent Fis family transcriptional regulator [Fictibacillus terranigra]|uniref:PrpR N-terminal domain-containing protein n=1 Tax=Fictibacillus terranigra TaxID=3058424 RepID=A0ABT8E175_9BACL|nr:sigma-54-dependent transcriptional regulator [Fictibacillus sp. CENA-BCM004]MDN4071664.1 PrpR N-terminal domain-containing protein [Fictibacillus sp. CENA-BCM004]
MKIKALFVAPYATMKNLIEECKQEQDVLDVHIQIGNLQEGAAVAKEAERQGFDVIISRGGTAKIIEEEVNIPVVDVHVSGYDMLRVLTLANDFNGKKAIVGFSNITMGAQAITDLLDISMEVFTIEEEQETVPLVQQLKKEGYELIMGDVVTVNAASNNGLNGILIQSGKEAILDSFQRAVSVYKLVEKKSLESTLQREILKLAQPDMLVFTENGSVVYENWAVFSKRPLSDQQLEDLRLQQYTQNKTYHRVMQNGEEQIKITINMRNIMEINYLVCFLESVTLNERSSLEIEAITQRPFLINQSQAMAECISLLLSAPSGSPILLIGEEGTGKRLLAKYFHYENGENRSLLASISAADLIELRIEDINESISTVYVHSLHLLEGQHGDIFIQALFQLKEQGLTVIASCSPSEQETLRRLSYHENVTRIRMPALRDRKEDLQELTTYFMALYHQQLGTSAVRIKEDAIEELQHYPWPGNVAELKALIKDAVLLEKGYILEKKRIQQLLNSTNQIKQGMNQVLKGTLNEIEEKIIRVVLEEEDFNQTRAAKRLGITRATLWRKLKS